MPLNLEMPEWMKQQLYEKVMRDLLSEPPFLAHLNGRTPQPPPPIPPYTPERFQALTEAIVASWEPIRDED